ncbi:hypothetical protein C0J52_27611 [Blattella germanica]|nr:hypothetical protein C0J52_27611 [Blattella germanica]
MLNGEVPVPMVKAKVISSQTSINRNGLVSTDDLHGGTKRKLQGILPQMLVSGAAFLLAAGAGMPIGYSAVLLPQLQVVNSTLPTDNELGSWIASVHSAATPVGSFVSGLMMDKWGRRRVLQICVLPLTLGWVMIAVASSHVEILAGRVLAGLAVGLSAAPGQVFLGEVAETKMRGLLGSIPYVSYSLGILIVYALGATLHWQTVAWLATILPIMSLISFLLLPESPVWLVRNDRVEEASKALNWLRGGESGGKQAKRELQQLVDRVSQEQETKRRQSLTGKTSSWRNVFEPSALKPIIIVNVFNLLQIISGTYLVIFYAVNLISETESEAGGMDKFLAAVLTAVVRLIFIILACFLLLWVGRRPLALFSGLSSSAASLALGSFLYYRFASSEPSPTPEIDTWIVTSCIFLYVATNTVGFFVLPGIAIGELLPVKIRGPFGGYIFALFNLALFFMAKVFPSMLDVMKSHGIFWMFGLSSLFGTVFVYLFFPETKGRSLEQIEDYFAENNVMWITRKKGQNTSEPVKL